MKISEREMRRISATHVFTARGEGVLADHSIVLGGAQILDVLPDTEAEIKYPDLAIERYEDCTILPGLVNCHSHTSMPGDGRTVEDAAGVSDGVLLLRAANNVRAALRTGVTTLADLGARAGVAFALRDALAEGEVMGPRLVLAGMPATSRMGHCWPWGGVVRDASEMRTLARSQFARGADLLKVMGTGGGTVGTDPFRPQFSREVLEAATQEARAAGRPAFAHCSATDAVRLAIETAFDVIVHGTFHNEEGVLTGLDDRSADLALEHGVYWNPTLAVARSSIPQLERAENPDRELIERKKKIWKERAEGVRRLHELGVPIVAGSDEGWGSYRFGGFILELEALEESGIPSPDVLLSGTLNSAAALGVEEMVGSLECGKRADLVVVEGRPFREVSALRRVQKVILGGRDASPGEPGFPVPSFVERWV